MKFRPLGDRVLVQRLAPETETAGGILIPQAHQKKMNRGIVAAVGAGLEDPDTGARLPLEVEPGDTILFGQYSGHDVRIDGHEMIIMRQEEILAVIEEPGWGAL